jgi:hypothetical protein
MKKIYVYIKRVEMNWYESNLSSNCGGGGGIYRVGDEI